MTGENRNHALRTSPSAALHFAVTWESDLELGTDFRAESDMNHSTLRNAFRGSRSILLTAILLMSGCESSDLPPAPPESVTSAFAEDAPGIVETRIVDPLPARAAFLKLPDGTTVPAVSIDEERNLYSDQTGYGPNFGARVEGGSSSGVQTGFGIGFPLFGGGGPSGHQVGAMSTSTIRFRIPDMAAYRRDWQRWILHVDLDDGGGSRRVIETLPPAPPAEPQIQPQP